MGRRQASLDSRELGVLLSAALCWWQGLLPALWGPGDGALKHSRHTRPVSRRDTGVPTTVSHCLSVCVVGQKCWQMWRAEL